MHAKSLLNSHWDGKIPVNPLLFLDEKYISPSKNMDKDIMIEISIIEKKAYFKYRSDNNNIRHRYTLMYIVALLYNIRAEDLHTIDKIDLSYFYQDHYLFFNNLNRFVLDMLIPIHILEFVILNKKITDISKLAAIFEVSEMAMAHQLKRLS